MMTLLGNVPDTPGVPLASVALYVDADNQSPQCAGALLNLFQTEVISE
jgi:hypothetical protein